MPARCRSGSSTASPAGTDHARRASDAGDRVPDETVHGDAFRFAHLVQMHTVLAAVQAWQQIEL